MFESAYSTSCSMGTLPLRLLALMMVPRGSGLALLSSVFSRKLKSLPGEFLSKLFFWEWSDCGGDCNCAMGCGGDCSCIWGCCVLDEMLSMDGVADTGTVMSESPSISAP